MPLSAVSPCRAHAHCSYFVLASASSAGAASDRRQQQWVQQRERHQPELPLRHEDELAVRERDVPLEVVGVVADDYEHVFVEIAAPVLLHLAVRVDPAARASLHLVPPHHTAAVLEGGH